MKKQVLLSLPLAALLAFPAVAQNSQSSSMSKDQQQSGQTMAPADQNTKATQTTNQTPSAGEMATGKEPLVYQQHEGFWGKINPFARKKYVQRQLTPVQDRVNELDQLTAANSKLIKDVDSRATEGIRMASAKATEADNHATEATSRAQQAHETAQQATQQLQTVQQAVEKVDQYEAATQVEIRFAPGQLVLSKKAKEALADVASGLKDQKGYILEVQGFSSGKGQAALQNSQQMADAVTRYLVLEHNVPIYRIYALSMGNAPVPASASANADSNAKPVRRTRGGRVEVSLLKNSIGNLASAAPASSTAPSTTSPTSNSNLPASDQTPPSSNVGGSVSGAATSTTGTSSSSSSTQSTGSSSTTNPSSDVSNPNSTQNPPSGEQKPEQKPPAKPPIL
jgi:outer membrane protein OmpA-like peptidoglycan-associated protein